MRKTSWILFMLLIFGALSLNAAETLSKCESKCAKTKLLGCKYCCTERARLASNACNEEAWKKYVECAKDKPEDVRAKCQTKWEKTVAKCQPEYVDITNTKCEGQ